jgi:hypothetical protein
MENIAIKTHKIFSNIVKLNKNEGEETFASLSLNPTIRWIKFILTDDKPNYNKQRVPQEEFANLIKTGVHMPIKMARKYIRDGHEFSVPIGTITSLGQKDDIVEGIAALWSKEFPNEVNVLEQMNAEGTAPQLSWEILYKNSIKEEGEVEALHDIALSAATIVNMPAYEGRTPIVGMASQEEERKLMDEKITELENKLADQLRINGELTTKLESAPKVSDVETLSAKVTDLEKANTDLTKFKEEVEAAEARKQKLQSIVTLFEKAGVTLPDDYLKDEKAEKLLAMSMESLEFMIQDLALFASKQKKGEAGKKKLGTQTDLPNVSSEEEEELSTSEIVKKLREDLSKK